MTNIVPQWIEQEITQSYIDYAMSVIISRALPDTRDGLKPVLRRILYAMYDLWLTHNAKYKKSAYVIWEVLGKYHPHGDSSVYDAMVRLTQPFNMRYPLVDWQWNFGSIDGDGAAAMRYTEARLTKIAEGMLEDIDLDTVDWRWNYDSSRLEPVMLPTRFPNHLCNGTMGIAVGMATNMAPHNLTEVIDASLLLLRDPDATIDDIMMIIKWPDFPWWGIIYGIDVIKQIYAKWKWSIVCRGVVNIETGKNNQYIIITQLPYQVNKSKLVEAVATLVSDKKIEWISDITDESSSKNPIRITIEIKKWFDVDMILTQLYKFTELQSNFSLNNISLVDQWMQPKLMNIKDMLIEFVEFRKIVVLRRSQFLLKKAQDRLHILEWLKRAVDIIDEIIALIRSCDTTEQAKQSLMSTFDFSDIQADYILALRLSRLVWLEIQKILEEIGEKNLTIADLVEIITNPEKRNQVIIHELQDIRKSYGDDRRTQVCDDIDAADLSWNMKQLKKLLDQKKEDVLFHIDTDYGIRILYQSRIQTIPEDTIELFNTTNQDHLVVITDRGELVVCRLKELWQFTIKSAPLNPKEHRNLQWNILFCSTVEYKYEFLVLLTSNNNLKKISKELLMSFKKFPTYIMNLENNEKIISVWAVCPEDKLWVVTREWKLLIFPCQEMRSMGKTSGGIKAVALENKDEVVWMFVYTDEQFIIVYSTFSAKLLNIDDLKILRRARKAMIVAALKDWEYLIGWAAIVDGNLRIKLSNGEIKTVHNNVMKLDEPHTPLERITQVGISMVYTPREEREKARKEREKPETLFT